MEKLYKPWEACAGLWNFCVAYLDRRTHPRNHPTWRRLCSAPSNRPDSLSHSRSPTEAVHFLWLELHALSEHGNNISSGHKNNKKRTFSGIRIFECNGRPLLIVQLPVHVGHNDRLEPIYRFNLLHMNFAQIYWSEVSNIIVKAVWNLRFSPVILKFKTKRVDRRLNRDEMTSSWPSHKYSHCSSSTSLPPADGFAQ